jgi:peptidoglycan/LPS O-acetylase OafA/YrhL
MRFSGVARLTSFFSIDAVAGFTGRVSDPKRPYLPELIGLRGIAILVVVCGHLFERILRFDDVASPLTDFEKNILIRLATPFSGCCIFFCISGFSLLTFLLRRTRSPDRQSIIEYSRRRIIRLCPPYFIVLIVTFLFLTTTGYIPVGTNHFFTQPSSLTVSLLAGLAFSHDLLFGTFPRLFPPGWFLETQFQFYLIGPAMWLLYLQIPAGKKRLAVGLFFLIACSAVSLLATHYGPKAMERSIIAFMPYFWTGAFIADVRLLPKDDPLDNKLRACRWFGWSGLAALLVLGVPLWDPALELAARIACLATIFYATFIDGTSLQRAMNDRWLTRIGIASYSIYLVHLQVLQVVTPLLVNIFKDSTILQIVAVCGLFGILAVMAASVLFYWLVERPCVAVVSPGAASSGSLG